MNTKPATIGDNAPPSPILGPTADEVARVEELTKAANLWLAATQKTVDGKTVRTIDDEESARRAEDYLDQIRKEATALDNERKARNEPMRKAIKENDDGFKPLLTRLETIKGVINDLRTKWLRLVQQRQDEARLAAARAAAEAQRKADEARKALEDANAPLTVEAIEEAEQATEATAIAVETANVAFAAKPQQRGDFTSRAGSLRTFWSAEITDYAKALAHYGQNPKVREAVQEAANADARRLKEAMQVPGVRAKSDQRAV